jgi:hypothetical protein
MGGRDQSERLVAINRNSWSRSPGARKAGHPSGAEPGNWYSAEPLDVEREMIGNEMLAWLEASKQEFIFRYRDHMREQE